MPRTSFGKTRPADTPYATYANHNGWAMWTYTIRQSAPSLAWWKENRPTVWQKYAKETTVKKFTIA